MARIGRTLGRVLQGGPVFNSDTGQTLGSYGPTVGAHAAEVVKQPVPFAARPISVTITATRQRLLPTRPTEYGIGPPLLTTRAPTYGQTILGETLVRTRPRRSSSLLQVVIVPTAARTFSGPQTRPLRTRPRRVISKLPVVVPAQTQPVPLPLNVNCLPPDRLARRYHRAPPVPGGSIFPPIVLQTFQGPNVTLARTRPRHTRSSLPVVVVPPSAQTFQGPKPTLTRTRPRRTIPRLAPPVFYPATSHIGVTLARARPRPTHAVLRGLIFYPVADTTILVQAVRTRPRPTTRLVKAPATLQPYAVTVREDTIRVALARARPRPTIRRVEPPTVLQVYTAPETPLVHTRPRATHSSLPLVIVPPSAQVFSGPKITLIRTRPRPTRHALGPLIFYPATSEIGVTLVRTRPRPTRHSLTAISYSASSEIATTLVRIRPRPTTRRLEPPIFYAQTGVGFKHLVQARPRPTTKLLQPPATLEPEPVALAEREIRVVLTRTRSRHTLGTRLNPPVFIPATSEIAVTLTRTRPRPTRHSLKAITYPATSTIRVALVRTRSKALTRFVAPPSTLQPYVVTLAEDTVRVTAVHTRPRHTLGTRLTPPAVLQTFFGPDVTLVHVRPRPTTKALKPPIVVRVPSVEQLEDTVRVTLTRIRPRPTERFLREPLVKTFPPVVTTFLPVALVKTRPRPTRKYLEPPTVVIPLPTLRMQTVQVALVRTRPRPTRHSLGPLIFYRQTGIVRTKIVRTKPRPTRHFLAPPTTLQTFGPPVKSEIAIRTPVEDRARRRTRSVRVQPIIYPQTSRIAVTTVRTRPRPTRHFLAPPTTLQVFGPPVEHEITIRTPVEDRARRRARSFPTRPVTYPATGRISVTLVRTRPRHTAKRIAPPTILASGAAVIRTSLVRTRPRRVVWHLSPPATLQPYSVTLREDTVRVSTVRTRPRHTTRFVLPPATLTPYAVELAEDTVRIAHVRTRPRPTRKFLSIPTVIRVPSVEQREDQITTLLVRIRPRATAKLVAAPKVVRPSFFNDDLFDRPDGRGQLGHNPPLDSVGTSGASDAFGPNKPQPDGFDRPAGSPA